MANIKRSFAIVIVLLFVILSTSCGDLGDFTDLSEYYDTFDEVIVYDEDMNDTSYSMEDFYSSETQNDLKTVLDSNKYKFLAVHLNKSISLDGFATYLRPSIETEIKVCGYLKDSLDMIKDYDADLFLGKYTTTELPDTEINVKEGGEVELTIQGRVCECSDYKSYPDGLLRKYFTFKAVQTDPDATYNITMEMVYDKKTASFKKDSFQLINNGGWKKVNFKFTPLVDFTNYNFELSFNLEADTWDGRLAQDFKYDGQEKQRHIELDSDTYIILRVFNNCFDHDLYNLTPCDIQLTNIMIRSN